jgi:chorismate synthase
MSHNTFGRLFRVTTWGESHGPAIGCVVDGCPPGIPLSEGAIQPWLDRRRPGTSRFVTQRREPDEVRILSGVYAGVTTGAPISLIIENQDARSKDYAEISRAFRPGHADFTYQAKYGVRDPRGGGRSSARETAMRVAAGAIARRIIPEVTVRAAVVQVGPHAIDRSRWDWAEVEGNALFCPDPQTVPVWEAHLDAVRKAGSSTGAVVEVEAVGAPAGWGAPVYGKLDAELAGALMSINAVKGVEIGAGFASAAMTGAEDADEMRAGPDGPVFLSNPLRTIDLDGNDVEIRTTGRHDPCVGLRAAPVAEAVTACVLADAFLRHRAQVG